MAKELTKNDVKQYIGNGSCCCPYCNSNDIEAGDTDTGVNVKYETVRCLTCEKVWRDIYYLVGIELDDDDRTEIIPGK